MEQADQGFRGGSGGHAFEAAVEAYRAWLRQLIAAGTSTGAGPGGPQALAASFAAQMNAWLRQAHPLVNGAAFADSRAARVQELLRQWSAAQGRLVAHWASIAQMAGAEYVARLGPQPPALNVEALRRNYDLWIECAERAYGATVRSRSYCDDQAALIHATVALTAEVRRHANSLAQAFDLPTRAEVNALHQRVDALSARAARPPARKGRATRPARKATPRARRKPK